MTTSDRATDDTLADLGGIARWADAMTEAILERNRAIRSAVAEGHSRRAVARAAGLSHQAVAKILARADGDTTGKG